MICHVLIFSFFSQDLAWAAPDIKLNIPLPSALSSGPVFPRDIASVQDTFRGSSQRTVYLLQDAHTNFSAQKNIASAIRRLEDKEGVRTVYVEGGFGDVSLSSLKKTSGAKKREETGMKYLRSGELSGAEYLSLTGGADLELAGVEDRALYWKSLELYRTVSKSREKLKEYVSDLGRSVDALKPDVLNPLLRTFDRRRQDFLDGELSFSEYFSALERYAGWFDVPLSDFPELSRVASLSSLEERIDFKAANQEAAEAVRFVEEKNPGWTAGVSNGKSEAGKLTSKNSQSAEAFYALLEEGLKVPDAPDYPELAAYFSYLKKAAAVQPARLLQEEGDLEAALLEKLTETHDEKQLLAAADRIRQWRSLIGLSLLPDDFQALSGTDELDLGSLTGFVNDTISKLQDHYDRVLFLNGDFEKTVASAEEFYALTKKRDAMFVDKMLAHMTEKNETKAVLVAGGYHSPNLKALLKEKNISFVSVSPQILNETNIARYERLLLDQKAGTSPAKAEALALLAVENRSADSAALNGARLARELFGDFPASASAGRVYEARTEDVPNVPISEIRDLFPIKENVFSVVRFGTWKSQRVIVKEFKLGWIGRIFLKNTVEAFRRLRTAPEVPRLLGTTGSNGIVMEYIETPSGLAARRGADFVAQITAILEKFHRNGVVLLDFFHLSDFLAGADGKLYRVDITPSLFIVQNPGFFGKMWNVFVRRIAKEQRTRLARLKHSLAPESMTEQDRVLALRRNFFYSAFTWLYRKPMKSIKGLVIPGYKESHAPKADVADKVPAAGARLAGQLTNKVPSARSEAGAVRRQVARAWSELNAIRGKLSQSSTHPASRPGIIRRIDELRGRIVRLEQDFLRVNGKPMRLSYPVDDEELSSGARLADFSRLRPGDKAGSYTVERLIKEGGWGTVYEVSKDGRHYAMKVNHLEPPSPDDIVEAVFYNTPLRFFFNPRNFLKSERGMLLKLGRSKRLTDEERSFFPALIDSGRLSKKVDYLVTELVPGNDLIEFTEKRLWRKDSYLRESLEVTVQVLEAIEVLARAGISHFDVKALNVMVFRDADDRLRARLVDFGSAQNWGVLKEVSDVKNAGHLLRTLLYLNGYTREEDIPETVRAIISRALSDDAGQHYISAYHLRQALLGALAGARLAENPAKPAHMILMAGGQGTRMQKAYAELKLLIPVLGKPLMQHMLDAAEEAGISVVVVTSDWTLKKLSEKGVLEGQGVAHGPVIRGVHRIPSAAELLGDFNGAVIYGGGDTFVKDGSVLTEALQNRRPKSWFTIVTTEVTDPQDRPRVIRTEGGMFWDIISQEEIDLMGPTDEVPLPDGTVLNARELNAIREVDTGIYITNSSIIKLLLPIYRFIQRFSRSAARPNNAKRIKRPARFNALLIDLVSGEFADVYKLDGTDRVLNLNTPEQLAHAEAVHGPHGARLAAGSLEDVARSVVESMRKEFGVQDIDLNEAASRITDLTKIYDTRLIRYTLNRVLNGPGSHHGARLAVDLSVAARENETLEQAVWRQWISSSAILRDFLIEGGMKVVQSEKDRLWVRFSFVEPGTGRTKFFLVAIGVRPDSPRQIKYFVIRKPGTLRGPPANEMMARVLQWLDEKGFEIVDFPLHGSEDVIRNKERFFMGALLPLAPGLVREFSAGPPDSGSKADKKIRVILNGQSAVSPLVGARLADGSGVRPVFNSIITSDVPAQILLALAADLKAQLSSVILYASVPISSQQYIHSGYQSKTGMAVSTAGPFSEALHIQLELLSEFKAMLTDPLKLRFQLLREDRPAPNGHSIPFYVLVRLGPHDSPLSSTGARLAENSGGIPVVDPQGNPTGRVITKHEMHFIGKDEYIPVAHIIYLRDHLFEGVSAFFQRRGRDLNEFPGYLDWTASGIFDEGETGLEAGLRELAEESMGLLKPDPSLVVPFGSFTSVLRSGLRLFRDVYAHYPGRDEHVMTHQMVEYWEPSREVHSWEWKPLVTPFSSGLHMRRDHSPSVRHVLERPGFEDFVKKTSTGARLAEPERFDGPRAVLAGKIGTAIGGTISAFGRFAMDNPHIGTFGDILALESALFMAYGLLRYPEAPKRNYLFAIGIALGASYMLLNSPGPVHDVFSGPSGARLAENSYGPDDQEKLFDEAIAFLKIRSDAGYYVEFRTFPSGIKKFRVDYEDARSPERLAPAIEKKKAELREFFRENPDKTWVKSYEWPRFVYTESPSGARLANGNGSNIFIGDTDAELAEKFAERFLDLAVATLHNRKKETFSVVIPQGAIPVRFYNFLRSPRFYNRLKPLEWEKVHLYVEGGEAPWVKSVPETHRPNVDALENAPSSPDLVIQGLWGEADTLSAFDPNASRTLVVIPGQGRRGELLKKVPQADAAIWADHNVEWLSSLPALRWEQKSFLRSDGMLATADYRKGKPGGPVVIMVHGVAGHGTFEEQLEGLPDDATVVALRRTPGPDSLMFLPTTRRLSFYTEDIAAAVRYFSGVEGSRRKIALVSHSAGSAYVNYLYADPERRYADVRASVQGVLEAHPFTMHTRKYAVKVVVDFLLSDEMKKSPWLWMVQKVVQVMAWAMNGRKPLNTDEIVASDGMLSVVTFAFMMLTSRNVRFVSKRVKGLLSVITETMAEEVDRAKEKVGIAKIFREADRREFDGMFLHELAEELNVLLHYRKYVDTMAIMTFIGAHDPVTGAHRKRVPTVVVSGKRDVLIPFEQAKKFADTVGAKFILLGGLNEEPTLGGHHTPLVYSKDQDGTPGFNTVLMDFVNSFPDPALSEKVQGARLAEESFSKTIEEALLFLDQAIKNMERRLSAARNTVMKQNLSARTSALEGLRKRLKNAVSQEELPPIASALKAEKEALEGPMNLDYVRRMLDETVKKLTPSGARLAVGKKDMYSSRGRVLTQIRKEFRAWRRPDYDRVVDIVTHAVQSTSLRLLRGSDITKYTKHLLDDGQTYPAFRLAWFALSMSVEKWDPKDVRDWARLFIDKKEPVKAAQLVLQAVKIRIDGIDAGDFSAAVERSFKMGDKFDAQGTHDVIYEWINSRLRGLPPGRLQDWSVKFEEAIAPSENGLADKAFLAAGFLLTGDALSRLFGSLADSSLHEYPRGPMIGMPLLLVSFIVAVLPREKNRLKKRFLSFGLLATAAVLIEAEHTFPLIASALGARLAGETPSSMNLWENTSAATPVFSKQEFLDAQKTIAPAIRRTPLLEMPSLGSNGTRVFLKDESAQESGSFKMRGVYYQVYSALKKILQEDPETLHGGIRLVTQSTGNHGIALIRSVSRAITVLSHEYPASAADLENVEPIVFSYQGLTDVKLGKMMEALDDYRVHHPGGGEIRDSYQDYEEAKAAREQFMRQSAGRALYMDHGGRDIMLGHGSAGLEAVEQLREMGISDDKKVTVIVPVGEGGPVGIGAAMKTFRGNVTFVLVQADGLDAFLRSLHSGNIEKNPKATGRVISDGIAVDGPDPEAVRAARAYADYALVEDERKAFLDSHDLLIKDLLNHADDKGKVYLGGTTALVTGAYLGLRDSLKAVRDADAVILLAAESNVSPVSEGALEAFSGARLAQQKARRSSFRQDLKTRVEERNNPYRRDGLWTRQDLAYQLGTNEETVRYTLAVLRMAGHPRLVNEIIDEENEVVVSQRGLRKVEADGPKGTVHILNPEHTALRMNAEIENEARLFRKQNHGRNPFEIIVRGVTFYYKKPEGAKSTWVFSRKDLQAVDKAFGLRLFPELDSDEVGISRLGLAKHGINNPRTAAERINTAIREKLYQFKKLHPKEAEPGRLVLGGLEIYRVGISNEVIWAFKKPASPEGLQEAMDSLLAVSPRRLRSSFVRQMENRYRKLAGNGKELGLEEWYIYDRLHAAIVRAIEMHRTVSEAKRNIFPMITKASYLPKRQQADFFDRYFQRKPKKTAAKKYGLMTGGTSRKKSEAIEALRDYFFQNGIGITRSGEASNALLKMNPASIDMLVDWKVLDMDQARALADLAQTGKNHEPDTASLIFLTKDDRLAQSIKKIVDGYPKGGGASRRKRNILISRMIPMDEFRAIVGKGVPESALYLLLERRFWLIQHIDPCIKAVDKIQATVGSRTEAWRIVIDKGFSKAASWVSLAEAAVSQVEARVGQKGRAWEIVRVHGAQKALEITSGARLAEQNHVALRLLAAAGVVAVAGTVLFAIGAFGTFPILLGYGVKLLLYMFFTGLTDFLVQAVLGKGIDWKKVAFTAVVGGLLMGGTTIAGYWMIDQIIPRSAVWLASAPHLNGFLIANARTLASFIVVSARTMIYAWATGKKGAQERQRESYWVARIPSYGKNFIIQSVIPVEASVAAEALATQFFQLFYAWSVHKPGFMVKNEKYHTRLFWTSYFFVAPWVASLRKFGYFKEPFPYEKETPAVSGARLASDEPKLKSLGEKLGKAAVSYAAFDSLGRRELIGISAELMNRGASMKEEHLVNLRDWLVAWEISMTRSVANGSAQALTDIADLISGLSEGRRNVLKALIVVEATIPRLGDSEEALGVKRSLRGAAKEMKRILTDPARSELAEVRIALVTAARYISTQPALLRSNLQEPLQEAAMYLPKNAAMFVPSEFDELYWIPKNQSVSPPAEAVRPVVRSETPEAFRAPEPLPAPVQKKPKVVVLENGDSLDDKQLIRMLRSYLWEHDKVSITVYGLGKHPARFSLNLTGSKKRADKTTAFLASLWPILHSSLAGRFRIHMNGERWTVRPVYLSKDRVLERLSAYISEGGIGKVFVAVPPSKPLLQYAFTGDAVKDATTLDSIREDFSVNFPGRRFIVNQDISGDEESALTVQVYPNSNSRPHPSKKSSGARLAEDVIDVEERGVFVPSGRPIVLIADDDRAFRRAILERLTVLNGNRFLEEYQVVLVENLQDAYLAYRTARESGHLKLILTDGYYPDTRKKLAGGEMDRWKYSGKRLFLRANRDGVAAFVFSSDENTDEIGLPSDSYFKKPDMGESIPDVLVDAVGWTLGARLAQTRTAPEALETFVARFVSAIRPLPSAAEFMFETKAYAFESTGARLTLRTEDGAAVLVIDDLPAAIQKQRLDDAPLRELQSQRKRVVSDVMSAHRAVSKYFAAAAQTAHTGFVGVDLSKIGVSEADPAFESAAAWLIDILSARKGNYYLNLDGLTKKAQRVRDLVRERENFALFTFEKPKNRAIVNLHFETDDAPQALVLADGEFILRVQAFSPDHLANVEPAVVIAMEAADVYQAWAGRSPEEAVKALGSGNIKQALLDFSQSRSSRPTDKELDAYFRGQLAPEAVWIIQPIRIYFDFVQALQSSRRAEISA